MEKPIEKKGLIARFKDWLVVTPPTPILTEAETQKANEKLALLEKQGYGFFSIAGIEAGKQAIFADYFFEESQNRLIKNNFRFVLIKVSRNLAGLQGQIILPLMKALSQSLLERKTLASEFKNYLTDLGAYISKVENRESTEFVEKGTVEKEEIKRGDTDTKKAGTKIAGSGGLISGEATGEISKGQIEEQKKTKEITDVFKRERKIFAVSENELLNDFENYLARLSRHEIPFLYDWMYDIRKNDQGEIVETKLDVKKKVKNVQRSLWPFGCLIWPITIVVAIGMGIADFIAPQARKVAQKNPNIRGNPFAMKSIRPFFVLRSVTNDNIEKDSATLKILKSLAQNEFAIFLLFTDIEIEEKLK